MRNDDAHGPNVQCLLDEASAALVRNPHKRRNARGDCCDAYLRCILERHASVLKIDEQRIVARSFGDVDNLYSTTDLETEGGAYLALAGEGDQVVGRYGCWSGHCSNRSDWVAMALFEKGARSPWRVTDERSRIYAVEAIPASAQHSGNPHRELSVVRK